MSGWTEFEYDTELAEAYFCGDNPDEGSYQYRLMLLSGRTDGDFNLTYGAKAVLVLNSPEMNPGALPEGLYGEAGTGKNSIVNVLLNTIPNVHLFINASSENGIDMIRQKAEQFALSASWNGKLKILVLNEADQLSPEAQGALRDLAENAMKTCRFIFTCNNFDKITAPIKSRCVTFEVKSAPKQIAKRLIDIFRQENVQFDEKYLLKLIKTYNTDIRKMIETSQSIYEAYGKLEAKYLEEKDLADYKEFFDFIMKNSEGGNIKKINEACKNEIFSTNIYSLLKDYICANFDVPELIICLADYAYKDRVVYDRDLNFMSCILDMREILKNN